MRQLLEFYYLRIILTLMKHLVPKISFPSFSEDLLRCLEAKYHWKSTVSAPPTKSPRKSDKDRKKNSPLSKEKNLGNKLKSSTRSRNKSKTQQKTDDTR
ncbi:unnamed protein product [Rhizophagus irregularis]|nr:unnamed protein product [Rhizophagus irregularis]